MEKPKKKNKTPEEALIDYSNFCHDILTSDDNVDWNEIANKYKMGKIPVTIRKAIGMFPVKRTPDRSGFIINGKIYSVQDAARLLLFESTIYTRTSSFLTTSELLRDLTIKSNFTHKGYTIRQLIREYDEEKILKGFLVEIFMREGILTKMKTRYKFTGKEIGRDVVAEAVRLNKLKTDAEKVKKIPDPIVQSFTNHVVDLPASGFEPSISEISHQCEAARKDVSMKAEDLKAAQARLNKLEETNEILKQREYHAQELSKIEDRIKQLKS